MIALLPALDRREIFLALAIIDKLRIALPPTFEGRKIAIQPAHGNWR